MQESREWKIDRGASDRGASDRRAPIAEEHRLCLLLYFLLSTLSALLPQWRQSG